MQKTFNSLQDIRCYCNDILENYECKLYGFEEHGKFVNAVAYKLRDYLHILDYDWKYGDCIPDIDDDFFNNNFIECFLSDNDKKLFTEYFYNTADSRLDDFDTARPWGCPWLYDSNLILKGTTIKEKAENYWNEVKEEVLEFLDEENKE